MSKYQTRQWKALLSYLCEHANEALSAQKIAGALKSESISLSSVYRNLADLERDGALLRIHNDSDRAVYFRYVDTGDCGKNLHLRCKKCGKMYRMGADETKQLLDAAEKLSGFRIDTVSSVLYGVCEMCKE